MIEVRNAAVAGQFYPDNPRQLKRDVDALLQRADTGAAAPKVLVVPHAGYIYSGSTAAAAYARLRHAPTPVQRVILLGPAHRVAFRGIATSAAGAFDTPLGQVPVDRGAMDTIAALPGVRNNDKAHADEHSLEVHLPFLQRVLGTFRLVPLVVGDAKPEQVATVLDALWGGPETCIVISTDLSHFLPYDTAREKDAGTCARIEALEPTLSGDEACGCRPLNGLLKLLKQRGLDIQTVAMNNSGDTAGSRDRVVGYGAWVVYEGREDSGKRDPRADADTLSVVQRQQLLHLARAAIRHGLATGQDLEPSADEYDPGLQHHRGSFVTLRGGGGLRGCIGSLTATRPLLLDVAKNAGAAAFRDPRFNPLRADEYPAIELHISVLSAPTPLDVRSRQALLDVLEPGRHGVILQRGSHRATYLPSVWAQLPDPERFVSELKAKAGLPSRGWSDDIRVSTYTTCEFS